MSQNFSIQGSPSPTVVTQQTSTSPKTSRSVYLACAVVSAIILVVSAIFIDYIVKNYTDSQGCFTNGTAPGFFVGCAIGMVGSSLAFLGCIFGFFADREDSHPPAVTSEQEGVR